MTVFHLLRHGEIDLPEPGCFLGQTDVALNARGRHQARFWREKFADQFFSAVWCSDLARTTETAEAVFSGRSEPIHGCREFREIHLGKWEGVPRSRIRELYPALWKARGEDLAGFRPPEGESFGDVGKRVWPMVKRIAEITSGPVCIVTHAGVIRVLVCRFLGLDLSNLFRIHLDYGSLSIVSLSAKGPRVEALNLTP